MQSYVAIYIVVKCIPVFVDVVIHHINDRRPCYFIFVGKDRLIFISNFNRIKSPIVAFVIKVIASVGFNRLLVIIYVIISYTVFIIYIEV